MKLTKHMHRHTRVGMMTCNNEFAGVFRCSGYWTAAVTTAMHIRRRFCLGCQSNGATIDSGLDPVIDPG